MKKIVFQIVVAIAGLLCLSCNETFEPNVDFGDKTYVNDYSGLVDQAKSLNERLTLLNKMLADELSGLKLSIDATTGAIKAQTSQVSSDLQAILTSLLNGFKSLKTVISETGDRMVYAINTNGEIIAFHLDQNGQLIAANITAKADELIKAINDQNLSLDKRMEALNTVVSSGLAKIGVYISDAGSALKTQLKDAVQSISGLSDAVLTGFRTLNTQIAITGSQTVYAINQNGQTIALHLDANGQLISGTVCRSAKEIAAAINSQTATLAQKIDALNEAITEGLLHVKVEITSDEIVAKLSDIDESLGKINVSLFDGLDKLGEKMDENGNRVVTAMNSNGENLILTIDKNGSLISVSITESVDKLVKVINDLNSTLAEKLDALNQIIAGGLADVIWLMDQNGKSFTLQFQNINENLAGINTSLLEGFSVLKKQMGETGAAVVSAINSEGQVISMSIDSN